MTAQEELDQAYEKAKTEGSKILLPNRLMKRFKVDTYVYNWLKLLTYSNSRWEYKGIEIDWKGLEYKE